ncbi:MAG: NPXTG-anchored protein [Oscillospiraceae bacterium]|nr:NPXTG-anchored protein [Oscillospiraceae bacterium]
MKITKILAGLAASVVAVSAMAATSFAASSLTLLEPGQAILGFGDADWKAAGWGKEEATALDLSYFTLADVTADGTYTVGIDLSAGYTADGFEDEETGELLVMTTANGIGAMGINLNLDAEDESYNNVNINIVSVKFDGVETIKDGATSYTNAEDGAKRSNVMNQWANYDATKADHLTLDPDTATSVMTDFSGEWTTCEVTFEVTGMPAADTGATGGDDAGDNAGSDASGDVNAPTTDKQSPDTGVEGVAAVAGVAVLAAGAVLVSKKRK